MFTNRTFFFFCGESLPLLPDALYSGTFHLVKFVKIGRLMTQFSCLRTSPKTTVDLLSLLHETYLWLIHVNTWILYDYIIPYAPWSWNIYLQNRVIYGVNDVNVGEYSLHGASGGCIWQHIHDHIMKYQ